MKTIFNLLLMCLLLSSCSVLRMRNIKNPKVEIQSVQIESLNLMTSTLKVTVAIDNPNDFPIEAENTKYKITSMDTLIADNTLNEKYTIPASTHSEIILPIKINTLQTANTLVSVLSGESIPVIISGSSNIAGFTIPFEKKGLLSTHGFQEQ